MRDLRNLEEYSGDCGAVIKTPCNNSGEILSEL
jgi:hypothetical protein